MNEDKTPEGDHIPPEETTEPEPQPTSSEPKERRGDGVDVPPNVHEGISKVESSIQNEFPTAENESPTPKTAADKTETLEPEASHEETTKPNPKVSKLNPFQSSFWFECLRYMSFGKYYIVLAEKKNAPPESSSQTLPTKSGLGPPLSELKPKPSDLISTDKIFWLTGERTDLNQEVLREIKKFGLKPITLRTTGTDMTSLEQAFTNHPHARFAIFTLSGDDFVYPKNGKPAEARMNIPNRLAFHFGYFLSKLGRRNIFALYYEQKNFILPSEFHQAIYTAYDKNGVWTNELQSRLKEAGYLSDETKN